MPENSRRHQRLGLAGTIFIELVSSGVEEDQASEVVLCKTIDISHSGLLVWVNQQLTVGAILQIGVELPWEESTVYLTGEVKWCRRDRYIEGRWRVGFALLDASDSDIDRWRTLMTEMGIQGN
ncbi:MAG: PilZ domain-containing protein [Proteobacteria bacterium]|nr:PilZ domain-containing protein [Pseudomonadota bacterium]